MSRHLTLRFAVLTAVATGAMLVPAAAAVASEGTAAPIAAQEAKKAASATPSPKEEKETKEAESTEKEKKAAAEKARIAEKEAADGKPEALPRGGVDAGEAPAADTGITTLAGSVTGALLLAGAGTFVLRRRSAERRDG
jgi:hypothetical protein